MLLDRFGYVPRQDTSLLVRSTFQLINTPIMASSRESPGLAAAERGKRQPGDSVDLAEPVGSVAEPSGEVGCPSAAREGAMSTDGPQSTL